MVCVYTLVSYRGSGGVVIRSNPTILQNQSVADAPFNRLSPVGQPPAFATPPLADPDLAIVDDEPVALDISAMAFTIPLPGENALDPEARAGLQRSADLLRQGKIKGARDACYAAIALDANIPLVFLRLAEINAVLGARKDARIQAEALARTLQNDEDQSWLWRVHRLLAYLCDDPLPALRQVVDQRIQSDDIGDAAPYAAYLIRLLSERGHLDEAMDYSTRVCELEPSSTDAALEHTVLLVKAGLANDAIDRWERAAEAGADTIIGRAALAPIMSLVSESEHWAMVAEVASAVRERGDAEPVHTYRRIAAAMEPSPVLSAGTGLLLSLINPPEAARVLLHGAGASGPESQSVATSIRSVTLASVLTGQRHLQERAGALQTAIDSLHPGKDHDTIPWDGLFGWTPSLPDLSVQLAETLSDLGDAAGAITLLSEALRQSPANETLGVQLADAYVASGKLGAALSVLDQLSSALRDSGRLADMASVLRRMSQIAPNNPMVKSRLIDAFLHGGFVAEARAELLHRADLEQQAGHVVSAGESLERAATLGWTIGLQEEAFAIYDRVLELLPNELEPRHALVTLYLQAGRVDDAANQQRAIVNLALGANKPQEAIAALHQIIGITPDDTGAYHHLAELLAGLGEYKQAERVYRRLAVVDPAEPIAAAKAESMAALGEQSSGQ